RPQESARVFIHPEQNHFDVRKLCDEIAAKVKILGGRKPIRKYDLTLRSGDLLDGFVCEPGGTDNPQTRPLLKQSGQRLPEKAVLRHQIDTRPQSWSKVVGGLPHETPRNFQFRTDLTARATLGSTLRNCRSCERYAKSASIVCQLLSTLV